MRDYILPIRCEVDYEEYVGRKKDGTVTRMWREKPRTMLKKIALVQALREALPEDFGGMYSQEEIPIDAERLPESHLVRGAIAMPAQIEGSNPELIEESMRLISEMDACKDLKALQAWWTERWPEISKSGDKAAIIKRKESLKKTLEAG